MKKIKLISAILTVLMLSEMFSVSSLCSAKMTKKQKKEILYINMADDFLKENQYDNAIECYNKIIEINPNSSEAYSKRGNVRYLQGKYQDAVSDYTKALEITPDKTNLYYNRGLARTKLKEYDEVLEDFTK